MNKCDICGIEGANYKTKDPEGNTAFLCEQCHDSCGEDYEDA